MADGEPSKTKTVRLKPDLADMIQVICDVETEEKGKKVSSVSLLDPMLRDEISKRYVAALKRRAERTAQQLKQAEKKGK